MRGSGRFADGRSPRGTVVFGRFRWPLRIALAAWFAANIHSPARADLRSIPGSLAVETLSETVPTAHAPFDFDSEDYAIAWDGPPIPETELRVAPDAIQWVRVADVLLLPRGRVRITSKGAEAGVARTASGIQPFAVEGGTATAELAVALLSGPRNPIEIEVKRGGRWLKGRALLKFQPRAEFQGPRVNYDHSCSPYQMRVGSETFEGSPWRDSWIFVGCRMVQSTGTEHTKGSLQAYVYWDNPAGPVNLDGTEVVAVAESLWLFQLRGKPGALHLSAGEHKVDLAYSAPDRVYWGFLGFGLGPYGYTFEGADHDAHSYAPVLTVYSGITFNESLRVVAFNATAIHPEYYTDTGVYLISESARFWDRKVSLNVMLGGHAIGFPANGQAYLKFGLPQGFELVYRDLLRRGHNLLVGSFIYPEISGKMYYNIWIRWGPARWFGEINYIVFREKIDERTRVYNRSFGVTIGFPLARYL